MHHTGLMISSVPSSTIRDGQVEDIAGERYISFESLTTSGRSSKTVGRASVFETT